MDKFKEDIFRTQKQGIQFPWRSLAEKEILYINEELTQQLHTPDFYKHILEFGNRIEIEDVENPAFLSEAFNRIPINSDIYFIWNAKNIDSIPLQDLIKYWGYIWYGPSDEALILFEPITKNIVMVTHWSVLYRI